MKLKYFQSYFIIKSSQAQLFFFFSLNSLFLSSLSIIFIVIQNELNVANSPLYNALRPHLEPCMYTCPQQGGWNWVLCKVPSNPNRSLILW